MDDKIEIAEWWLPSNPEQRVHGALSWDPADGASLTLLDMLLEVRTSQFYAPTVLGETFDGVALTLMHPVVANHADRLTPTRSWTRSTLLASTMLRGHHVSDPDAFVFSRAVVRFAGLRDVCLQEWPSGEDGEWVPFVTPGLGARQANVIGGSLLFRQRQRRTEGKYSEASETDVDVVICSDNPLSLADFDDQWLNPLEALTILAARGPTVLQQMVLAVVDDDGAEHEVEVLTRTPSLAPKPQEEYKPLVRLATLGQGAMPFIARWWDLYQGLGPAADFLSSALSGEMFVEQKLVAAMSFLESYHRNLHRVALVSPEEHRQNVESMIATLDLEDHKSRYRVLLDRAIEQSARERAEAFIVRAHETLPGVPGLDSTLAKDLVNARNAVAHLSRSISKVLKGLDLTYAVARLRLVLQVNLLLDLGLDSDLVASMVFTSYEGGMPIVDYREDHQAAAKPSAGQSTKGAMAAAPRVRGSSNL